MTRAVGPGCGIFRALPRSEVPGSGGVLASRASAGQRRQSPQGVGPGGRGSRAGIRPLGIDRMTMRRSGRCPGGQAEVGEDLRNDGGMFDGGDDLPGAAAMGQCSRSISNTRLSNRAQLRRAGAAGGSASAWSVQDDGSVDCHALLREYFARQLRRQQPEAWPAAHRPSFMKSSSNRDGRRAQARNRAGVVDLARISHQGVSPG